MAALSTRFALTTPKCREAAHGYQRLLQGGWVVAAVIDDGLAVTVENTEAIGHFLRPDHVTPPHFCGLELEASGNEIHHPLRDYRHLGGSRAAVRRIRDLVGGNDVCLGGRSIARIRGEPV